MNGMKGVSLMPQNAENTGVSVNNQEVLRDDRGRFLKGGPSANPGGRPKGSGFKQRLNELVGEDSRELALLLSEIAFYDQKSNRDKWPKYKPADRLRALELILKYKEQLPVQKVEAQVEMKTVNVHLNLPDDSTLDI